MISSEIFLGISSEVEDSGVAAEEVDHVLLQGQIFKPNLILLLRKPPRVAKKSSPFPKPSLAKSVQVLAVSRALHLKPVVPVPAEVR
jgi:hypothetical protein